MKKLVDYLPSVTDGSMDCKKVCNAYVKHLRAIGCEDWDGVPNAYIRRTSEKAYYMDILMLDSEKGEGVVSLFFWCPKKFVKGVGNCTVPLWFVEKKIEECFA